MQPRFTTGETLSLTSTLADYPAGAGWVLHHRLVPTVTGAAIAFSSSPSGDDHVTTVAAATTAGWAAGTYTWASWVTDGTAVHGIAQGRTTLLPDPRVVTAPLDLRSDAQTALDNVRALLRGKATADVLRYSIGGRSLDRYSVPDLLLLESKLSADVGRESRAAALAAGRPDPRRFQVRTGRA